MVPPLENREHLVRVALLFAGGFSLFLVLRALLVPEGFGVYGHFRAVALDDNRHRPLAYAGRGACLDCHADAAERLRSGPHAGVGCEACHGALARHAEDASTQKAEPPHPREICLTCHGPSVAKPAGFPQIVPADHSPEGSCADCHPPHAPTPP